MWRRLGLRGAIPVRGGRFNVRAGGVVLEVFDTARGDWVGVMRVSRFGMDAGKWLEASRVRTPAGGSVVDVQHMICMHPECMRGASV